MWLCLVTANAVSCNGNWTPYTKVDEVFVERAVKHVTDTTLKPAFIYMFSVEHQIVASVKEHQ